MKNTTTPRLLARIAGWIAVLFLPIVSAHAQNFTGYDEIVPAGPPGSITVLDGTGKVLPANRSYVIGIEGGTRGSIEFHNWTGTAEYPIVITNRHGTGRVKVTDVTGTSTPTTHGIVVKHCRYVQIRGDNDPAHRYGIEIAKVGHQWASRRGLDITGRSSYVEAMFLEIHSASFAGIMAKHDPDCRAGFEWTLHPTLVYHDIKLHDNYIHDVGGEGFYIGWTAWPTLMCSGTAYGHEIHGLKIYRNLVERGGWDGIQFGSARTGAEVYDNVIVDSGTDTTIDPATGKLKPGNTGVGVQIGSGASGLFYNNTIINSRGANIALFGVGDNYLFNNFLIGGETGMFSDNRPDPPPSDPDARQTLPDAPYYFFNNTVVGQSGHGLWTMNDISTNYFQNNIVVANTGFETILYDNGAAEVPGAHSNNVEQTDYTGLGFVNPSLYDFRITGTSTARDVGTTLSAVTKDFQGNSRPQGTAYDAGASEAGPLSTLLVASPPSVGSANGAITASTIGGTAPYSYAWAHGPTTATISNLAAGLYTVTVTDAVGAAVTEATYLFEGAEMGMPVHTPRPNEVHAPTMNPPSGTYPSTRSVTLSTATAGATIRYTTNGTTPSPTNGTVYSSPISVSATGTIKAIAYKTGMAESPVSVATYFIGTPPATPGNLVTSASDRRAYISWDSVSGANRYTIKRGTSASGPFTILTALTTTNYIDNGLTNGTTYYYVVTASNIYGTSPDSAPIGATPMAYAGTLDILHPLGWGQASGSAYCPATGAFDEKVSTGIFWDNPAQRPDDNLTEADGSGSGTLTSYANRHWYIDFGVNYAQWRITEMWTRYRWSSSGDKPGFGGFWWDDDFDNVNDGITETRVNFENAKAVPGSGTERIWARDRDFGALPVQPLGRYLVVSVGPVAPNRANEFAFVGYLSTAPHITAQPQSQAAAAGSSVTFSVAATGTPTPTYQWQKDGVAISGATSSSYTISNAQSGHAGNYTVVVTNSGGSVTSSVASLVVASTTLQIITPLATGTAVGSSFCGATGAFNEQPTWDAVGGTPSGISATPHGSTVTAYANRHWYIDLGPNYANIRITQMWTRYRPNSPGSFTGFASMWWDDDNDNVNDGTTASGMDFGTAQNQANVSTQLWVRDALFSSPVTPQGRYLVVSTGASPSDRPNEFAFVGYVVP